MFSQVMVWFCIILASITSIIPDIIIKSVENLIEKRRVLQLREKNEEIKKEEELEPGSYFYLDPNVSKKFLLPNQNN
jgi:hypothetical protein